MTIIKPDKIRPLVPLRRCYYDCSKLKPIKTKNWDREIMLHYSITA